MNQMGVDQSIIRQWEARVRRMVLTGSPREQILYMLADANWPFEQADAMVRSTVRRERGKAIAVICVCGPLMLLSIAIGIFSITQTNGGIVGIPITTGAGFIYGIIRLSKIRA